MITDRNKKRHRLYITKLPVLLKLMASINNRNFLLSKLHTFFQTGNKRDY